MCPASPSTAVVHDLGVGDPPVVRTCVASSEPHPTRISRHRHSEDRFMNSLASESVPEAGQGLSVVAEASSPQRHAAACNECDPAAGIVGYQSCLLAYQVIERPKPCPCCIHLTLALTEFRISHGKSAVRSTAHHYGCSENPFRLPPEGDPRLEALKQAVHSRRGSAARANSASRASSARSQPALGADASRPTTPGKQPGLPGFASERVRSARAAKCGSSAVDCLSLRSSWVI